MEIKKFKKFVPRRKNRPIMRADRDSQAAWAEAHAYVTIWANKKAHLRISVGVRGGMAQVCLLVLQNGYL